MTAPANIEQVAWSLDAIDKRLERLSDRLDTKADGAATVRELQSIRAELSAARAEGMVMLDNMKKDLSAAVLRSDATANDVIRSGRSETLKLLVAAMTAFAILVGAVVAAVATGKVG